MQSIDHLNPQRGSVNTGLLAVLLFAVVGIAVVALSYLLEAVRRKPTTPTKLRWALDIPIQYTQVNGHRLRYVQSGRGPTLVLLHTLRTQLDLFEKVIPALAEHFSVYAIDYPGHGYSDIPTVEYDAKFFADIVEGFLDDRQLKDVTLAGVSIGASISLILASRRNPRVSRAIVVNPYDYDAGRGLARSSLLGWIITHSVRVPFLCETIMRLRNFPVMKAIFAGGVVDVKNIPVALLQEMYAVGNRDGHYKAFVNLLRNARSWEDARQDYCDITVPVLIVWADHDWARREDRENEQQLVPAASVQTVDDSGHFLPLDRPEAFVSHVRDFCQLR